ncbi:hypothetical protein M5K25_016936 [Dendrobium thyrsiflorum]|uniref:Uncharacterized protein n=1 Tax=Dendrobium thyrsiflorum TaxID=117978 RepID=A0ABD0UL03_DENTH
MSDESPSTGRSLRTGVIAASERCSVTLTCVEEVGPNPPGIDRLYQQVRYTGVIVDVFLAEEDESLLEDVRVELLQFLADLVGEELPPVAVVPAVESLAGVEGSRYETPPSFEFSLLGRVPRFLLQLHFAPQGRKKQISNKNRTQVRLGSRTGRTDRPAAAAAGGRTARAAQQARAARGSARPRPTWLARGPPGPARGPCCAAVLARAWAGRPAPGPRVSRRRGLPLALYRRHPLFRPRAPLYKKEHSFMQEILRPIEIRSLLITNVGEKCSQWKEYQQVRYTGVIVDVFLAEEDESLLEDVRVELLQFLADLVGEELPPVAVVPAVESLAGVEGSRYETPPSFEFSLLGRVPRFLLQLHFAPQGRKKQISNSSVIWNSDRIPASLENPAVVEEEFLPSFPSSLLFFFFSSPLALLPWVPFLGEMRALFIDFCEWHGS